MNFTRNDDRTIINIGDTLRIERGPVRRTETATEALLADDVTAAHYHVGGRDALGNVIELGAPMHFIDWLAAYRGEFVFTLYRLQAVEDEVDGEPVIVQRFLPEGDPFATEDEALSAAMTLAMAAQ